MKRAAQVGLAAGAAGLVAADLLVPGRPAIGGLVVLAMAIFVAREGLALVRVSRRRSRLLDRAGVLKLSTAVLVGLAGLAVARGYIAYRGLLSAEHAEARAGAAQTYTLLFLTLALFAAALDLAAIRIARLALRLAGRPALLLAGSFAALIVTGTLLLALPISVRSVEDISLLDALFTITSGVCVTGLTVNDVGITYSAFGEAVLLGSIQLGGIGIMTLAGLALTLGGEGSLSKHATYGRMLQTRTLLDMRSLVQSVVVTTFAIEAAGTLVLWWHWAGDPRLGDHSALWFAMFHAVSAFCNAGFSLFPTNLMGFAGDPFTALVLGALIVIGGLGFPVIRELARRGRDGAAWRLARLGQRPDRLSMSSNVVLKMTALLIAGGAALIGLLEVTGTLAPLGLFDRGVNALFASIAARTAGFNMLAVGDMRAATLMVVIALMFIGGSPGSCAGGIKTTTAAVLFGTLRGELRGREPHLGRRAIFPGDIRQAVAVTALSALICFLVTGLLSLTESDKPFLAVLFEAVSAFSTTGLSTGITPSLSGPGKLIVVATMFVGRVGPLTIALAVGAPPRQARYRLATENLPIG